MSTEEIYNYRKVHDQLSTGGQPTAEQLQAAAADGFTAVINLAPYHPDRELNDEAGLVQSLGLDYRHIPVNWNAPQASDFATFETAMRELADKKVLLHCAANFRVTAFYALYAQKNLGWSEQQAEDFRASIWAGSDYPIWEQFIKEMRAKLA